MTKNEMTEKIMNEGILIKINKVDENGVSIVKLKVHPLLGELSDLLTSEGLKNMGTQEQMKQ